MVENIQCFALNDGPFNTRLHVINHVDMILGISPSEQKIDNKSRVFVFINHDTNEYEPIDYSAIPKEDFEIIRSIVLKKSLFATKWEQLIPINGDDLTITYNDLQGNDDIDDLIDLCIEQWMSEDGVFPNLNLRQRIFLHFLIRHLSL